tara:strand:- start:160 stop:300 length:141 start_codon:yes stop_codon:yes gene_type:complete
MPREFDSSPELSIYTEMSILLNFSVQISIFSQVQHGLFARLDVSSE